LRNMSGQSDFIRLFSLTCLFFFLVGISLGWHTETIDVDYGSNAYFWPTEHAVLYWAELLNLPLPPEGIISAITSQNKGPQEMLIKLGMAIWPWDKTAKASEKDQKPPDNADSSNQQDNKNTSIAPQAADIDYSQPVVAIYCTHTTENYAGETRGSEAGGVYHAAEALRAELSYYGIPAVVSSQIHDYPDWNASYQNSLITAQKLLDDYPSIQMLIDLHRDAGIAKSATTIKIDGESAARIMIVVGSNSRLEHPHWQENLAFAQSIGDICEKIYPGWLRDVRVQSGRYNQHLSPHAILIEMGSEENTLAEAYNACHILAAVINDSLQQINSTTP